MTPKMTAETHANTPASQIANGHLAAIVRSSNDAIASKTTNGIVITWNAAAERMFGYAAEEIVGKSIRILIPDDRQQEEDEILSKILLGAEVKNFDTIRLRKDGREFPCSITVSPIHDNDGNIVGASKIVRDITEQTEREELVRLLLAEVNHRSKNMLALVQAIARQISKPEDKGFIDRLSARLQSLTASQDALIQSGWRGADVETLIRFQLAHFQDLVGNRIMMTGAPVALGASAAQVLGMAIHELATNASKYGALSNDHGRVNIEWRLLDNQAGPRFEIEWRESEGPVVHEPTMVGFGTSVLGKIAKSSLTADVYTTYDPAGVSWKLTCKDSRALHHDQTGHDLAFPYAAV
jgi:PAS domain S-box-containing protein